MKTFKQFVTEATSPTIDLPSSRVIAFAKEAAQEVASHFKHETVKGHSTPSAPNSSKFTAAVGGMIEAGPVRTGGSYYEIAREWPAFLKIGGAIPHERRKFIQGYFVEHFWEIVCEAADVEHIFKVGHTYQCSDGKKIIIGTTDGTNWGGIGVRIL